MYRFKYLIPLYCFLVFFNCQEEQQTNFSEINITTDNNTIVEVNIPEAYGNEIVADLINIEIQKTIIAALHMGDPDNITSASIEESIADFNNEYTVFQTEFPEITQLWEAQIDGEVMYQSPEVTSVAITSYTNTGGAHGVLNIALLNFESKTGMRFQNNHLFNNIEAFKTLAEPYFKDATKDKSLPLDDTEFKLPANIGYSDDGIVLLYNTYEVAPYSSDLIEFTIPFEETMPYLVFNSL